MSSATIAIKRIHLEDLVPNPDNPRRITDKHPSLPSLAQSLKEMGQVQPIVVRPIETQPDEITGYQIVAGERRWRAAKLAGLEQLDCIVRELDDQQAFSICVVENLQREDLHWLEEARGVAAMVAKGWDVETIAKEIGKSAGWVHLRAKLSEISPKWQKEVEDTDSPYFKWPASALEVIARLPIPAQDELLKDGNYKIRRAGTAAELKKIIDAEYLHLLKSAPWDLADAKLVPKAGACTTCPKRSSCQQALFEDQKADSCLDAVCWKSKDEAHQAQAIAALKKQAPKAVTAIAKGADWREVHEMPDKITNKAIDGHSYEISKEGAKGAKPAIIIAPGKAPRLAHIVEQGTPGYGHSKASKPTGPKPMKERLEQFLKRRTNFAIGTVIGALGGQPDATSVNHWDNKKSLQPCAPGVKRPTRSIMVAIAIGLGMKEYYANDRKDRWGGVSELAHETDSAIDEQLWDRLRSDIISQLIADRLFYAEISGACFMADACGLSWSAIMAKAQDENPLPRTLALHFNEDGSRKADLLHAAKPAKKTAPKKKALAAAKA